MTNLTIADVARAAGVNPKVARAKLRRHYSADTLPASVQPATTDTWEFKPTQKKALVKFLTEKGVA